MTRPTADPITRDNEQPSKAGHERQVLARKLGALRRSHRELQRTHALTQHRLATASEPAMRYWKMYVDEKKRADEANAKLVALTRPEPCGRWHYTTFGQVLILLAVGVAFLGGQITVLRASNSAAARHATP